MKSLNAHEYIKLNSLNDDFIISRVQQKEPLRGCDGKVHLQEERQMIRNLMIRCELILEPLTLSRSFAWIVKHHTGSVSLFSVWPLWCPAAQTITALLIHHTGLLHFLANEPKCLWIKSCKTFKNDMLGVTDSNKKLIVSSHKLTTGTYHQCMKC